MVEEASPQLRDGTVLAVGFEWEILVGVEYDYILETDLLLFIALNQFLENGSDRLFPGRARSTFRVGFWP